MLILGFSHQLYNIGVSLTSVSSSTNTYETIYPNPATGQTQIKTFLAIPSQLYLSISDVSGQKIRNINLGLYEAGNVMIPIEVNTLPNAVYYLTLNGNNISKTFKLIKE